MASSRRSNLAFTPDESIQLGLINPKLNLSEKSHDKRVIILLILSPICTLLFTAIPVLITFHGIGADIYRFLEPVISLPLQYFIMTSSEVFIDHTQGGRNFFGLTERSFLNIWFLLGAAIYAQGAGMHATAILAKRSIRNLLSSRPEIVQQYPEVNGILDFFRKDLEHAIGHYLYATGYVIITWAQLFAYRRQKHDGLDSLIGVVGWIAGGILFGILNASVAVEFPGGPLVVLIYVLVIGVPLAIFLFKSNILFTKGRRLVLQSYLIGYTTTLVIDLIWIAVVGGFKNREDAGLLDH